MDVQDLVEPDYYADRSARIAKTTMVDAQNAGRVHTGNRGRLVATGMDLRSGAEECLERMRRLPKLLHVAAVGREF
jgi:hypothetical protein